MSVASWRTYITRTGHASVLSCWLVVILTPDPSLLKGTVLLEHAGCTLNDQQLLNRQDAGTIQLGVQITPQ